MSFDGFDWQKLAENAREVEKLRLMREQADSLKKIADSSRQSSTYSKIPSRPAPIPKKRLSKQQLEEISKVQKDFMEKNTTAVGFFFIFIVLGAVGFVILLFIPGLDLGFKLNTLYVILGIVVFCLLIFLGRWRAAKAQVRKISR